MKNEEKFNNWYLNIYVNSYFDLLDKIILSLCKINETMYMTEIICHFFYDTIVKVDTFKVDSRGVYMLIKCGHIDCLYNDVLNMVADLDICDNVKDYFEDFFGKKLSQKLK